MKHMGKRIMAATLAALLIGVFPEKNAGKGDEPEDEAKRVAFIRGKIPDAPRLIPIYSHRYMPLCSLENYPVLSVHGVDVIYYGGNLEEYFNIEFGDQKQSSLDIAHIEYVPFWSDLM